MKNLPHWRRALVLISAVPLCLLSACNRNDWQSSTHPTSGQIRINGQIPERAILMLHSAGPPVDKRHSQPWAMVEPDGTFAFTTYEKRGDGAPAGEYHLTLYWPVNQAGDGDRLRGAYVNPQKPLQTITVTTGRNIIPPIELNDVAVTPSLPEQGSSPQKN